MSAHTAVLTGPIEGGKGAPFGAPAISLADRGYVVEEFLLSGIAGSYEPVPGSPVGIDGRWEVQHGAEAPYVTRFYVVRPTDPSMFNGVLVVNWQNVTAGVDLGVPTAEIYRGYAWAGVTTQRVAIDGQPARGPEFSATSGLPAWDPERYGTLSHPGDAWSYDIFTQAARALIAGRSSSGVDPLGGLVPQTVLASGGSQSAIRLGSYLNIAHPHERLFDGFQLTVHWGMCPPPPDQSLQQSFAPRPGGLTAGSARLRDDGGVPIMVLCSETEALNNYPVRQPDSATFRFWEMAGTAHAAGAAFDALADGTTGLNLLAGLPEGFVPNTVDWGYVADAALRHLVGWVQQGTPPPVFPPIEVEAGQPPVICRDADGNATGGMRLPELVAATGTHRGTNTVGPAASLLGETVPFSRAQLTARYPTREHYVDVWNAAVTALSTTGLDLGPDLEELRARGLRLADALFTAGPEPRSGGPA